MSQLISKATSPVAGRSTNGSIILPGFFPDPSIVRVNHDYYLINSTFQYFPAIVISHSRALIHWNQIGHVFTNTTDIDLNHFYDGCGVWAPDISYHDGYFYVFYCLVQLTKDRKINIRGNYVVRSKNIFGPYSKPVQLTDEGNDPSHFVDDDGQHYLLYAAGIPAGNGIKIAKLNNDCSRITESPRWINLNLSMKAPEGPHLLKKDGYYYLTLAASGGLYDSHHQLLARAAHIDGPYELCPHNPILRESSNLASFGHQGHAKFFQDNRGQYHAVYLCQRRINGYSPLGRETAISELDWPTGDWPTVANQEVTQPSLKHFKDDFDHAMLHPRWQIVRNPDVNSMSLSERPGYLRIYPSNHDLSSIKCRNVTLVRETSHHYKATTKLHYHPRSCAESGIVCYYDTASYISLGIMGFNDSLRIVLKQCKRNHLQVIKSVDISSDSSMLLRVEVDQLRRSFYYSNDGEIWAYLHTIDDASFLSDQGTPNWGFTGTMVGLYSIANGSGNPTPADFDWFSYEDR